MRIRQKYTYKTDTICIEYEFNRKGLIVGMQQIDPKSKTKGYTMPTIEINQETLFKIINMARNNQ